MTPTLTPSPSTNVRRAEGEGLDAGRRRSDSLYSIVAEVRGYARAGGKLDLSERDALLAVAAHAEHLLERLQAIIDWADFALQNPAEFDSHGVRNLDGPVFDEARAAISKATGSGEEVSPPTAQHFDGKEDL